MKAFEAVVCGNSTSRHSTLRRALSADKLKAANLAGIADTERAAVVEVDRVMRSGRPLAPFAGRQITLQLAKGERVKVG